VRELENFIERSVILSSGASLRAPLAEIKEGTTEASGSATLEQVERDHIVRVLQESGGVVTTAATRLGLHRTTLNAMMRRLGISRKDLQSRPRTAFDRTLPDDRRRSLDRRLRPVNKP
jgi:formate hydrogenlyase transcriptional activator